MTLDHLQKLVSATSVDAVWTQHCAQMGAFGFDRLLYGYSRLASSAAFGERQDALILSNHDPDYLDRYLAEDLLRADPVIQWAEASDGALSWREIAGHDIAGMNGSPASPIQSLNREFGITAGYTISFRNLSHRGIGAISLTGASGQSQDDLDAIWDAHGPEIILMNRVMHLTVTKLPARDSNRLTKRQREVLEWVAQGKTIPEICLLIDRKQATVEKHLRLAREAMNAQTTAQAVLKASVQNQIFTHR